MSQAVTPSGDTKCRQLDIHCFCTCTRKIHYIIFFITMCKIQCRGILLRISLM